MVKQTILYTTTTSITIPTNCLAMAIQCYGGGASGTGMLSTTGVTAGSSGGQYTNVMFTAFTPGYSCLITVAATTVGTTGNGANGYDSSVLYNGLTLICLAKGGIPSIGNTPGIGSTASGIGDIIRSGGNGAAGVAATQGGGGGGGAGPQGNGGNAVEGDRGASGGYLAGRGGYGGIEYYIGGNGLPGENYGGGGAGAMRVTTGSPLGGDGAPGLVIITYYLDKGNLLSMFD